MKKNFGVIRIVVDITFVILGFCLGGSLGIGTLICAAIVRLFTPLRVTDHEEKVGLDVSQHGEPAYPSFNGMD